MSVKNRAQLARVVNTASKIIAAKKSNCVICFISLQKITLYTSWQNTRYSLLLSTTDVGLKTQSITGKKERLQEIFYSHCCFSFQCRILIYFKRWCMCVRACVRACMRVCVYVCVCVRACMCVCARAPVLNVKYVCAGVCLWNNGGGRKEERMCVCVCV